MTEETPAGRGAVPMLSSSDVSATAAFLCDAFGFRERRESRHTEPDGRVSHAEIERGEALVMLGLPSPYYRAPRAHAAECPAAAAWLANANVVDGVLVYVADVDAHCEHARAHGAEILRGPEDAPYGRLYTAADRDGHRWMFMAPSGSGGDAGTRVGTLAPR